MVQMSGVVIATLEPVAHSYPPRQKTCRMFRQARECRSTPYLGRTTDTYITYTEDDARCGPHPPMSFDVTECARVSDRLYTIPKLTELLVVVPGRERARGA